MSIAARSAPMNASASELQRQTGDREVAHPVRCRSLRLALACEGLTQVLRGRVLGLFGVGHDGR
ncbi:hypothetical protein, partial [Lichenibacterium minor]|uniref:hypothetical protein n=1 Tax=Lichenibacterium minor TaxID=2316528 RepID=UPI001A923AF5